METFNSREGVSASEDIAPNEIVNPGPDRAGQTENINSAMQTIGALTWDERRYFMRRFSEVFSQESELRSAGKDFDTAAYN